MAAPVVAIAAVPAAPSAAASGGPQAAGSGAHVEVTAGQFSFAAQIGGTWAILVSDTRTDEAPVGKPTLVSGRDDYTMVVQAEAKPEVANRIQGIEPGARFTLFDGEVPRCEGTIKGVAVVARVNATSSELLPRDDTEPEPTDEEIAEAVWDRGRRDVVALLDTPAGCEGATWARSSALRAPRFAERSDPSASLAVDVDAAFRALPVGESAKLAFEGENAYRTQTGTALLPQGTWDEEAVTEVVRLPWNGRTFVRRWMSMGEACGFSIAAEATWEPGSRGLSLNSASASAPDIRLFLDVNGDGRLEAIVGSLYSDTLSLVPWPAGDVTEELRSMSVPTYGCPC